MVIQNDYFHNHNQSKSSSCPSIRIDLVGLIEIIHFSSDLQGLFCYTICLNGQKNDLVTHNEFFTTNKKWEHPTANRKLPSLEKYYFILLISKGLYIKTSLRVMALEISIYSKNETGQIQ